MIKSEKNYKADIGQQDGARSYNKLWVQIVVCMILGITIGLLISEDGLAIISKDLAKLIAGWLVLPGHIFLALIQMIMIPLVSSSIVLGIADTENKQKLKRMGLRIIPYFIGTTIISIIIGVTLALLIEPGQYIDSKTLFNSLNTESLNIIKSSDNITRNPTIHERIVNLIPANPLNAALNESMLQIVVLSIFMGIALISISPVRAQLLLNIARSVREVSMVIVSWAMLLAPLAVLGFLSQITMQVGITALIGVSAYMGTVLAGLILLLLFYILIAWLIAGIKPSVFISSLRGIQLLAFSTSSSAAVMPLSIKVAEEELRVQPSTANFIIPLGATINMDGTAIYQVIAAIFLTQVFGIDLSLGGFILLVTTTVGASIGAPSVPGVGIVILAAILNNMGVPASGIALIIGVDRILDMSRTAVNVSGDLTACVVMDKWLAYKNYHQNG